MSVARRFALACALAALTRAGAQTPADSVSPLRRVTGRVVLGTRDAQKPVRDAWVVLHRVGSDRAGPLDSMRTAANGGYSFRYRPTGDTAAIYFAAATHGGIAYFTAPFRSLVVGVDEATITVFDTTTGPIKITTAGRHLIIGGVQPNGHRSIGEVFELQNDTTVTLIARDSVPLWTTHIPPNATGFALNSRGDIAASAVTQRGSVVGLFAPLSPGMRQLAFTYELPSSAFPINIPVERPTGVLELLVQDPSARISGGDLSEIAPVSADGRTFRRFQAQNVEGNDVIVIDLPQIVGRGRLTVIGAIAGAIIVAMLGALFVAINRRRGTVAVRAREESPAEALMRDIALLDAEYQRTSPRTDAERDAYLAQRAALKARLSDALAASGRHA